MKNSRSTGNLFEASSPSRIIHLPQVPKEKVIASELSKSKQIQMNNLLGAEMLLQQSLPTEGNDSDTASVESGHSRYSGGSVGKKSRTPRGKGSPRYRRHHNKPGSSPPLPRRARVRQLTPMVKTGKTKQSGLSPRRLHYDELLPGQISPRRSTPSPTISPFSSAHSSKNITPSSSFRNESKNNSPYDFMQALNTAIQTTSTHPPRVMRQNGVTKTDDDTQSPGSVSPTLLEIENQLQAMQTMINQRDAYPRKHYTSPVQPEEEEEDDDSEDDDETSTESSSEEDVEEFVQLNMIKPQYHSGGESQSPPKRKPSPTPRIGAINRGRLVQRRQAYRPRLFSRRRLSRLDTIVEEVEERFHSGVCKSVEYITGEGRVPCCQLNMLTSNNLLMSHTIVDIRGKS